MHLSLILTLLVQIVLILALSRAMGVLFRRIHQPQVMGEMIAGIMLGPSLFGWLAPNLWQHLFRPDLIAGSGIHVNPTNYLEVLSQIGVIFFLFLVGLELDPKLLKNRGHQAVIVSHVSILAPFLLGAGLTLVLYRNLFNDAPHMKFTSVALFLGAAMSITAFPVLARVLTERNLHKTKVGAIAITCAAVDDVTAWCMLAFVVGIARANGFRPGMMTALLALIYIAVMFLVVRPFLKRLQAAHDRRGRLTQNIVAVIFLLILLSAWTTEAIGIHALFGAFLMGAMMPKGSQFVRTLSEKLEDYTVVLLLPIFFAYTGLRTQIGLIDNAELWRDTLLIIAVACAGKFGGSTLAGRACGLGWREASTIGVLMNTRGLMELVILNIGLEEGVITPAVFAMMVIMALVTTAMTTPALHWVFPAARFGGEEADAKAPDVPSSFTVLVSVAMPRSGAVLGRLGAALIGCAKEGHDCGQLVALNLRRPVDHEAYRSGLDEALDPKDRPELLPLINEVAPLGVTVEPLSFVTRDAASDICAVSRSHHVDLVLMGYHKPVFGKAMLGGTVHRVLNTCHSDVGIFVDRGMKGPQTIMVPYLGGQHDRLALELASRLARNTGATVTVLHVVPPGHEPSVRALEAERNAKHVFEESGMKSGVEMRLVADDSPVAVVLREAEAFDLIIVGVAEEWGLESHLFGWRAERIARDCPVSMLIVRRAAGRSPAATTQAVVEAPA